MTKSYLGENKLLLTLIYRTDNQEYIFNLNSMKALISHANK